MKNQHSIEDNINQALDESVDNLPPEIRRQLNQARFNALNNKPQINRYWKMAGAVSFVVLLSWSFRFTQQPNNEYLAQEEIVTPFSEVLVEDFDMLDDLEFAYWLAEESDIAIL